MKNENHHVNCYYNYYYNDSNQKLNFYKNFVSCIIILRNKYTIYFINSYIICYH